jgi:hypothetical protein
MESAGEVKIRMQFVTSHLELDEVVSPELVLVDPELAEIARRQLRLAPEWRPQPRARAPVPVPSPARLPISVAKPPVVVPTAAPGTPRPRVTSVVATAVPLLLLGAVVFAMVTSEMQARFQDPVASLGPASVAPPPPGLDTVTLLPTTEEVEVRTLALLTNGSTATPAALLNDRVGLVANNVWIDCRRVDRSPQFTCRLGAGASSSREWLLIVAIARDGMEVLTWGGSTQRANRGAVGSAL